MYVPCGFVKTVNVPQHSGLLIPRDVEPSVCASLILLVEPQICASFDVFLGQIIVGVIQVNWC